MTELPWFRFYSKFVTDPDIEELSFEDQRHYVFLLCLKNNGLLDKEFPSEERRSRAIARRLGLQGEAFTFAKERLVESGLIDENWHPRNWEKLQFRSDSSAERVRRHRAKKKKKKQGTCDGVTGEKRYGNAVDKNRVDKKREEQSRLPDWLNVDSWSDFVAHRKEIKKPLTDEATKRVLGKLSGYSHADQKRFIDTAIENRWVTVYPKPVEVSRDKPL